MKKYPLKVPPSRIPLGARGVLKGQDSFFFSLRTAQIFAHMFLGKGKIGKKNFGAFGAGKVVKGVLFQYFAYILHFLGFL